MDGVVDGLGDMLVDMLVLILGAEEMDSAVE